MHYMDGCKLVHFAYYLVHYMSIWKACGTQLPIPYVESNTAVDISVIIQWLCLVPLHFYTKEQPEWIIFTVVFFFFISLVVDLTP